MAMGRASLKNGEAGGGGFCVAGGYVRRRVECKLRGVKVEHNEAANLPPCVIDPDCQMGKYWGNPKLLRFEGNSKGTIFPKRGI